jgi:hypothetical protein
VIGTNDVTLSDGSTFRIPRVGWYGIDGRKLVGAQPYESFRKVIEEELGR